MPPPVARTVMREGTKKAALTGRATKAKAPVAMTAMRVVKKKAVTKIEAPVTRKVKVEKGEAPVIAPRTAMKAKAPAAATPRAMKVETPVGKRHRATKDMSAALSGSKKRGQSSSAEPLADAGSFPACNVAAVDDAYSCLAQLQKALAVPIAEPVGTAAPQLLTATLSEKTSLQWQPEPLFSSSQIPGPAVEPGEVVVGGNCKSWTCGCPAHLRRHPRCGGEGPVRVHLTRDVTVVGRGDTCHVALRSLKTPQMISRNHAVIRHESCRFVIADQGSLNGVFINGERVHGERAICSGDIITFGAPIAEPEFDYIFEEKN